MLKIDFLQYETEWMCDNNFHLLLLRWHQKWAFSQSFRDFCSFYNNIYVLVILLCSIFSTFGVYGGEKAAHTIGKYSLKAKGKKK